MKIGKYWLAGVLMAIWPNPAAALQSDAAVWQKITTDQGCIAYLYDRNNAQFPGWRAYHWTGSCAAGQVINGQGVLQEHGLFFEERFVTEYHGTMVQGYFQGEMTRQPYQVSEKGEWDSSKPIAELAFTAPYDRGCWVDKQSEYTQKLCEQDRSGLIVAKISKKPLWRDVKGSTQPAPPAASASPPKPADGIWTKMQSNGCTLIFNHGFDGYTADYSGDFSGNTILSLAPSFSCGADGLAQGPVRIVTTWQISKGSSAGAISVDTMTASASSGLLDGNLQTITSGAVSWAGQTRDYVFAGGCHLNSPDCDKAKGQQLRSEYLAARGQENAVSTNAKPQTPAPPAFSKTETVAFENLGTSLAELIKNVGPGGFQNEQAKIEAVVAQLGLSFYSGQGAAFGGEYARVQSVQNAVRTLLAGKGASADAGQLVDLVLGAVKTGLMSAKQASVATPAVLPASALAAAPAPVPASALAEPAAETDEVNDDLVKFSPYWSVRAIGNCNAILNHRAFRLDAPGNKSEFTLPDFDMPVVAFEWTGGCNANGLIEGPGHLKIYESQGNGPNSTLSMEDHVFTAKDGMPEGVGTYRPYNYEPDYDHPGKYIYTPVLDDFTRPREVTENIFKGGCVTKTGFREICEPVVGAALRARYMTDRSIAKPAINQRREYEKRIETLAEAIYRAAASSPPPPPPAPVPSAIAIGPKLLSDIGSMMRYPLEAERNEWQGRVGFSLSVSAIGSVQQCTVTGSSGYAVLDNATCDLMRRATFSPARNAAGSPVAGTYNSAIRWQVP